MRLISLKYDYTLRELFSYESVRKQFLSDVLGIPLEEIRVLGELGDIPEELSQRVMAEKDIGVLSGWLKAAAQARDIRQFREECQI